MRPLLQLASSKPELDIPKLWELLPRYEGSVVRWFAKRGSEKEGTAEQAGDFSLTSASLARAAHAYRDWNFYIQPNPSEQRAKMRSSTKDITHWSFLFVDVDPIESNAEPLSALLCALHALSGWTGKIIDPIIIDSGRGAQAWIRLEDVLLTDELEKTGWISGSGSGALAHRRVATACASHWLKRLNGYLQDHGNFGCAVDSACSDLPRPMRCPGTVNLKTGHWARLLSNGKMHMGLAHILLTGMPQVDVTIPLVTSKPGLKWQKAMPFLTLTAKSFILTGHTEPGRHKACIATLRSLRDQGVTIDEARKALVWGNKRCRPEPLGVLEIERMLADHYPEVEEIHGTTMV